MRAKLNADVIIEHMIAGFIALDSNGLVLRINARLGNMLRVPPDQIVGSTIFEALPDLAGAKGEMVVREGLATRSTRKFEHFSPSLYNWFDILIVPVPPDQTYLFVRDVSDRERAIQSEGMREALRRVLGDAPIAITLTSGSDHRIDLMNSAARALVGGRNFEGQTMRSALPDIDEVFFHMIDRVFESGEAMTVPDLEVTYDRNGDGFLYTGTFNVTYQPMRDATGVVTGIMSTSVERIA